MTWTSSMSGWLRDARAVVKSVFAFAGAGSGFAFDVLHEDKENRMRKLALLLVLTTLTGCAKMKVAVHPGAISNLDSYAYDVLLVEQDTINQARTEFLAGQLPANAKPALNAAIDQYNIAEAAWQQYHANGAGQPALQSALDALVSVVGNLIKMLPNKGGVSPVPVPTPTSEVTHVNYAYAA